MRFNLGTAYGAYGSYGGIWDDTQEWILSNLPN